MLYDDISNVRVLLRHDVKDVTVHGPGRCERRHRRGSEEEAHPCFATVRNNRPGVSLPLNIVRWTTVMDHQTHCVLPKQVSPLCTFHHTAVVGVGLQPSTHQTCRVMCRKTKKSPCVVGQLAHQGAKFTQNDAS